MASTAIFPSFRHSVSDGAFSKYSGMLARIKPNPNMSLIAFLFVSRFLLVPADDWTVEEVFQWTLLQSHKETDGRFQRIEKSLKTQLEEGFRSISNLQSPDRENSENSNPNETFAVEDDKPASKSSTTTGPLSFDLVVSVLGASRKGKVFPLHVTEEQECLLGRSRGNRFRENGVSLSRDLEISTTHGKFEIVNGKICFTDTGSTNGTKVEVGDEDMEIARDEPYELSNGTVLVCGATRLEVSIQ